MDLQAKITLDNTGLVAGLQQALAPLQQAIAGMQQLAVAIQRLAPANAAAASQVARETSAIQANTSAVAQNTAAKANNAKVPMAGGAGRKFPWVGRSGVAGMAAGIGLDALGGALDRGGYSRGAAVARVGGDVGSMASMGAMAGPWGAAAGAVLGLLRGVSREWGVFFKKTTEEAEGLRKALASGRVSERAGNREIMREDSGDALQDRIESLQEAQRVLRDKFAQGLVDPQDVEVMRAQEASMVRQIALARERLPLVKAAENRKENAATLAAMNQRDSRADIADMALPAVLEMLKTLESRMSANGYQNSDPAAVKRDAADVSALRARRESLQQNTIKDALQWLGKVNAGGLAVGANDYTKRGIGTGTAVGPALSGVERNTSLANQLLTRIATRLETRTAATGVFA